MRYDGAPARRIARLSETPEMHAQRSRVIELLAPRAGWRVLDVGCGPGHLAEQLATAVGPRGQVCGVDTS
jgi:ubiquinone/menaquinone biosynthesis C-methylase UbiE